MIETHFHCLPGIDDGPRDFDEAVALCRAAADEGTHTIVATPHVLHEQWSNEDVAVRESLRAKLNALLDGRPHILPGCETFFASDLIEIVERVDSPVVPLNSGAFVLIEFPAMTVPKTADSLVYELSLAGVTPVIAHPERNAELSRNRARASRLVELGAWLQVTAGAVAGDFGANALEAVSQLFDEGLVHLVASDAHNLQRRPPRLKAARDIVTKGWGTEVAARIFDENAQRVISGSSIACEVPATPRAV